MVRTDSSKGEEKRESDLFGSTLSKAMSLCSKREFCTMEIMNRISSWGVGAGDAEKIAEILRKENFLNDERYASAFTRDKLKYNKWGRVKIAYHLKSKNIPAHIIRSALDSIDNDAYNELLRKIIGDHRKTIKAKNQYDLKTKLLRFALSKGFESSLIYDILERLQD
jgi:regulatory protein